MEKTFKKIVLCNGVLLICIVVWGAYQQPTDPTTSPLTDIGGLAFLTFSLLYFFDLTLLYKFKKLGKILYLPLVIAFIILGFFSELVNPMQITRDLFYLFVFYIVSPAFFVFQGILLAILYLTPIKEYFYKSETNKSQEKIS
jgi:hypothetical protein